MSTPAVLSAIRLRVAILLGKERVRGGRVVSWRLEYLSADAVLVAPLVREPEHPVVQFLVQLLQEILAALVRTLYHDHTELPEIGPFLFARVGPVIRIILPELTHD